MCELSENSICALGQRVQGGRMSAKCALPFLIKIYARRRHVDVYIGKQQNRHKGKKYISHLISRPFFPIYLLFCRHHLSPLLGMRSNAGLLYHSDPGFYCAAGGSLDNEQIIAGDIPYFCRKIFDFHLEPGVHIDPLFRRKHKFDPWRPGGADYTAKTVGAVDQLSLNYASFFEPADDEHIPYFSEHPPASCHV